jgi:hypothetical protein
VSRRISGKSADATGSMRQGATGDRRMSDLPRYRITPKDHKTSSAMTTVPRLGSAGCFAALAVTVESACRLSAA